MQTIEQPADLEIRSGVSSPAHRRRANPHLQTVRLLIAGDTLSLVAAGLLALAFTSGGSGSHPGLVWVPVTVAVTLAAFAFYRLYERDRQQIVVSTLDEWRDF